MGTHAGTLRRALCCPPWPVRGDIWQRMLSDACRVGDGGARGRCLLAARDVAAGELLASCAPAVVLAYRASGACDACLAAGASRCARCGHAAFCGDACGAAHAASGECSAFAHAAAAQRGVLADLPHRFALRLLCRVASGAVSLSELEELAAAPPAQGSADADALHRLSEHLHAACAAAGVAHGLAPAQIARLLCAVRANAHTLYAAAAESEGEPAGAALVLCGAQLANHACRPSCEFYNVGCMLHVRALVDVAAGAELTVGYVGLEAPAAQRQQQLWAQFAFRCDCDRCGEEQHAPPCEPAPAEDSAPADAADWRALLAHADARLNALDVASARPGRATSAALLRAKTAAELLDKHAAWRRAVSQPHAALAARFGGEARPDAPPPHAVALAREAEEIEAHAAALLAAALEVLRIARGADHAVCAALADMEILRSSLRSSSHFG